MQVSLAPYRTEFGAEFRTWCDDPGAFAFLRKSCPGASSPDDLFAYFLAESADVTEGRRIWAVVRASGNALVAHLELKATDKTQPGEGELVAFVAPRCRRRGVASATVANLLAAPDLSPEFRYLVAFCRPANTASTRILSRAGFALVPGRSSPEAHCYRRGLAPDTAGPDR
jgi:RimJ/RimL family protein N-acetyltransferase